jgi:hypothetical protein
MSLFKLNGAYGTFHTRIDYADDTKSCLLHAHAHLLRQHPHQFKGTFGIEREPTAQEIGRVNAS